MYDSVNILLILRRVRPTSVCNLSGIHVNDHWTISDTFHSLWLARDSGYTCCNRGKMDVREMSSVENKNTEGKKGNSGQHVFVFQ